MSNFLKELLAAVWRGQAFVYEASAASIRSCADLRCKIEEDPACAEAAGDGVGVWL